MSFDGSVVAQDLEFPLEKNGRSFVIIVDCDASNFSF